MPQCPIAGDATAFTATAYMKSFSAFCVANTPIDCYCFTLHVCTKLKKFQPLKRFTTLAKLFDCAYNAVHVKSFPRVGKLFRG